LRRWRWRRFARAVSGLDCHRRLRGRTSPPARQKRVRDTCLSFRHVTSRERKLETEQLAEGEELGSNILHLGDNDPRSPNCRGERTSGQHARLICRMSALHPIATKLWHCNEMTRRATSRHMHGVRP
jgi:hypothetical protein